MKSSPFRSLPFRGTVLAGLFLLIGAAACAKPFPQAGSATADGPCPYYKIGEVRGVTGAEVQRAMRRYGGDFVRSRLDSPGGDPNAVDLYSAEIFRYESPNCMRNRR